MTAEELIKLLDHAAELIEKSNEKKQRDFEEWLKKHDRIGGYNVDELSD